MSDIKYEVKQTEFQGKCVVASQLIKAGEHVVTEELPFVWQSVSVNGSRFHKFCEECGTVLPNDLLLEFKAFMDHEGCSNREKLIRELENSLPSVSKSCLRTQVPCPQRCGITYCSEKCFTLAKSKGHDWLCESYQTVRDSYQQMRSFDSQGHYGLAAKFYAQIAAHCLQSIQDDPNVDISAESLKFCEKIFDNYHTEDFTRTIHAYRTGNMEVDPEMFKNIIFPAYFSSVLSTPYALCKEIFQQSGAVLWGTDAKGRLRSEQFLSSPIFTEPVYARIVGTFAVNCLSVHVSSPVEFMLAEAIRVRSLATASGGSGGGGEVGLNNEVISFLERYRDRYLRNSNKQEEKEKEEEEEIDEHTSSNRSAFLGMSGSGLFPLFSKTNHSCLCNTSVYGSNKVCVSIVATEDILPGTEITNCYIHHVSLNGGECKVSDAGCIESSTSLVGAGTGTGTESTVVENPQHALNRKMTKKQRYRALRQYVFECTCPLCRSQVVDSDEDSD
jgi:hypothetical protein